MRNTAQAAAADLLQGARTGTSRIGDGNMQQGEELPTALLELGRARALAVQEAEELGPRVAGAGGWSGEQRAGATRRGEAGGGGGRP